MQMKRVLGIVLGAIALSVLIGGLAHPMAPVMRADDGDDDVMVEPGPPSSPDGGFVECVPTQDTGNHWTCTDTKTGQTWMCTQNFEWCVDGGVPEGGAGGGSGGNAPSRSTGIGTPGLRTSPLRLPTVTPTVPASTAGQGLAGSAPALKVTPTPTPTTPPGAGGPLTLPGRGATGARSGK